MKTCKSEYCARYVDCNERNKGWCSKKCFNKYMVMTHEQLKNRISAFNHYIEHPPFEADTSPYRE